MRQLSKYRPLWCALLLGALLWVGAGACSCSNLLSRFLPQLTAAPTASPPPAPTATPLAVQGGGQRVEIVWTEKELNDYLAAQVFNQQGLEVSDMRAVLGQGEVTLSFYARHTQSGLNGEITLRGQPVVSEGKVYVRITDVTLGPSFSGFMRLVAENLVREALKQYSGEAGIPVSVEDIFVEAVEITPGKMIIRGYKP